MDILFSFNRRSRKVPSLPEEVLIRIFKFVRDCHSIAQYRLVSRDWNKAAESNDIWSLLAKDRWPTVRPSTRIRNWQKFFISRYNQEMSLKPIECHPIENCYEFDFQCPLMVENLQQIEGCDDQLYCNKCSNAVKLVSTQEALEWECAQGNCVAFMEPELNLPIPDKTSKPEIINIMVIGDAGVGKTRFIRQFYQSFAKSETCKTNLAPIGENVVEIYHPEENATVRIFECNATLNDFADLPITYSPVRIKLLNLERSHDDEIDIEKRRAQLVEEMRLENLKVEKVLGMPVEKIDLFVVCFSVVDYNSFENAMQKWHNIPLKLQQKKRNQILVGLQTDKRKSGKMNCLLHSHVRPETARGRMGPRSAFLTYLEVSQDTIMMTMLQSMIFAARTEFKKRLMGCVVT